jgi:hypothetical protein
VKLVGDRFDDQQEDGEIEGGASSRAMPPARRDCR